MIRMILFGHSGICWPCLGTKQVKQAQGEGSFTPNPQLGDFVGATPCIRQTTGMSRSIQDFFRFFP